MSRFGGIRANSAGSRGGGGGGGEGELGDLGLLLCYGGGHALGGLYRTYMGPLMDAFGDIKRRFTPAAITLYRCWVSIPVCPLSSVRLLFAVFPFPLLPLLPLRLLLPLLLPLLALPQLLKHPLPQLALLAQEIRQLDVREPGVLVAGHAVELGDDIAEEERFAGGLADPAVVGDGDGVDVEVVVGGLVWGGGVLVGVIVIVM